ncbi:MAG: hypothetical protein O7J95_21705 [Planctomycetota bacterium]|nr:hypothetical protein [Planctomycetota bacterium]
MKRAMRAVILTTVVGGMTFSAGCSAPGETPGTTETTSVVDPSAPSPSAPSPSTPSVPSPSTPPTPTPPTANPPVAVGSEPAPSTSSPGDAGQPNTAPWTLLPLLTSTVSARDGKCVLRVTTRTAGPGWNVKIRLLQGGNTDSESVWREYEIVGQPPARPRPGGAEERTVTFQEEVPGRVRSLIISGQDDSNLILEVPKPPEKP